MLYLFDFHHESIITVANRVNEWTICMKLFRQHDLSYEDLVVAILQGVAWDIAHGMLQV
jgi:hypothetical protein